MAEDLHIIAEAGTNHNGELAKAKNLIDIASRAGADSVKFQIIYPWGLYLPGNYEYGHYDIKDVIRIREEGMLQDSEYADLAEYAKQESIEFSASVFDEQGISLLDSLNPPYFKTASCDLNNTRLLRKVAERGRKMIISTGMSTLKDIEFSLKELQRESFDDIVLLHCVSIYPANLEQINLSFIDQLKSEFGFPVGFSDHTGNSLAALMALAKGATWFEKHFTEDRQQEGFDHAYAMEERGLQAYVQDLKDGQLALDEGVSKISEKENYTRKRARRSLYASKNLKKGDVIQHDDVLCVRPEGPLDANLIDVLVGQELPEDLAQYMPFLKKHLKTTQK